MKVHVSKEAIEPTTDLFLRDEDGDIIALFTQGHEEIADRVAAFLNGPPDEELIGLLHTEHVRWLARISISCSAELTASVMEHLNSVKGRSYQRNADGCKVCAVLGRNA